MFGGGLSEADKARARAGELVTLANGAQGTYVNGKWRIVKGASAAQLSAARSLRGSKKLSQASAKRAFERYYKQRSYKSDRSRKAARSRDLSSRPKSDKKITDTTRYLRNPGRLDYPGVDVGERVSAARGNAAALAAARGKARSPRRSAKMVRKQVHRGGRAVSLKTAVKLLRSYYSQRYGRQQQ